MPDDLDVSEFLTTAEDLENNLLADEVFEEESASLDSIGDNVGQRNFNVQPSAPHPESQSTVPPGVAQPTTMQSTSISPVPTVESTEGTPLAPMEDQHAIETANYDDEYLQIFEELTGTDEPVTEEELKEPGSPDLQLEAVEFDDTMEEEISELFDSLLEDGEGYEYNEANMDQAAQPMNAGTTQPPSDVSNMSGGSSGSTGSTPGVQTPAPTKPAPAPAGQTMTPGGSTGTTPSSAPMSQGYGAQQ